MKRACVADVLAIWCDALENQAENLLNWSVEANRIAPSRYTAMQLAYAEVASSVTKKLRHFRPKGFSHIFVPDDWELTLNHHRGRSNQKTFSQAAIASAVRRSEQTQEALRILSQRIRKGED